MGGPPTRRIGDHDRGQSIRATTAEALTPTDLDLGPPVRSKRPRNVDGSPHHFSKMKVALLSIRE
jgi:hypothetical protein